MRRPCEHCPWRVANHGRRTPWGFYTKANLRRLWGQLRRGGRPQGCHPTDPGHPDHVAAGAKPGSQPQECPGSVILVYREFEKLKACAADGETIDGPACDRYMRQHRDGLTRNGLMYWLIARYQFGGVPVVGGAKLPEVDLVEDGIGRI